MESNAPEYLLYLVSLANNPLIMEYNHEHASSQFGFNLGVITNKQKIINVQNVRILHNNGNDNNVYPEGKLKDEVNY